MTKPADPRDRRTWGRALNLAPTRIGRRAFLAMGLAAWPGAVLASEVQPLSGTRFRRIPLQYIAALGDPTATTGAGVEEWGWWAKDPGPRGVWLRNYDQLVAAEGRAPAGWAFDPSDWWVDENGLLMEKPAFNFRPGHYIVTGMREKAAVLTVHEPDEAGVMAWTLGDDATLHDVTHLKCRASRYRATAASNACSPADVPTDVFQVAPDDPMPVVPGCVMTEYTVLFVIGVAVESG